MYQIIKNRLIFVKFLLSRILRHSRLCYLFYIKQNNFIIRFFPSSVSTTLWFNNFYSFKDYQKISNHLKQGSTFVDVGANIGHLSLFAKTCVGKEGRVIAIEGNPRIFKFLKSNIET